MKFAKIVFTFAGIWGVLVLTPFYFAEDLIGRQHPPAITHPEYFYGFVGVALAFQVVFLIIGRDPVRYRPLMIAGMIEKFSFIIACTILYLHGRMDALTFAATSPDLILGILFAAAYAKTASAPYSRAAAA